MKVFTGLPLLIRFRFIERWEFFLHKFCLMCLQEMKLGWPIVVGTIVGSFGAAFGSVGGIGGGGIFVPMLGIIIGFDQKSATAMSKCKIQIQIHVSFFSDRDFSLSKK